MNVLIADPPLDAITETYRAAVDKVLHVSGFGRVTYRIASKDRYGSAVALVWAGKVSLSCWQLQRRQAVYVARWDGGGRISRACR